MATRVRKYGASFSGSGRTATLFTVFGFATKQQVAYKVDSFSTVLSYIQFLVYMGLTALLLGSNTSVFEPLTALQLVFDLFVNQRIIQLHVQNGRFRRRTVVGLKCYFCFQHR